MENPQAYAPPEQKNSRQKIDREFQVMRGQDKCASDGEYSI